MGSDSPLESDAVRDPQGTGAAPATDSFSTADPGSDTGTPTDVDSGGDGDTSLDTYLSPDMDAGSDDDASAGTEEETGTDTVGFGTDTCAEPIPSGAPVVDLAAWGSFGSADVSQVFVADASFTEAWRCELTGQTQDPAASQ